jgi:HK97 gp10 family phage protein
MRTAEVKEQMKAAIFRATTTIFEIDMKARAKELAPPPPKTERQAELPEDQQYKYTGTNMRSIDTEVTEVEEGVHAEIFTQSGYGGYLELGTAKMAPRPFIFPAFQETIVNLSKEVKKESKND